MPASDLMSEIEDLPPGELLDWPAFSTRVQVQFSAATTSQERGSILAARAAAMDLIVTQLELHGDHLEKFIDASELEYKRFIVQETRVDGVISYQEMLHVTDREIAAGRMSEDYALRAIAVEEASPGQSAAHPADHELTLTNTFARLKSWLHLG